MLQGHADDLPELGSRYTGEHGLHAYMLRAQFVVQRLGEVGNTVVPGTPLLKIVDPDSLWVATRVDESVIGRVKPGQSASILLRSGETLPGKVARIARQSDAATRELDVHVAFDTPPQRFAIVST